MTFETEVRDLLERRTAATEIDDPANVHIVTQQAQARIKRTRARGGLATVAVVVLLLVGVGVALRDPQPSAVFAGETDASIEDPVLRHVVPFGDGYVGVGGSADEVMALDGTMRLRVLSSSDGLEWRPVSGATAFGASSAAIAMHKGVVSVALIRTPQNTEGLVAETRHELVILTSVDLEEWQESVHPLTNDLFPEGGTFTVGDVVAADAGLLVAGATAPPFLHREEHLEDRGYDLEDLCELTSEQTVISFRVCGTTERIRLTADDLGIDKVSVPGQQYEQRVLFVPTDQPVFPVLVPELEPPTRSPFVSIYASPDGYGIAGDYVFESVDGEHWTRVDTGEDHGTMMAVRDTDRVYRTSFPVARFGPDDPLVGMAFLRGAGEWQAIDLAALYENEADVPRWFTGLQVAPAGWTLVAQRSSMAAAEIGGVTRERRTGPSAFTLSADGYELSGRYPYGPATLTNANGTIVRQWDQLEPKNLRWSGFTFEEGEVVVPDEQTGDPIVSFTDSQWAAVLNPLQQLRYEIMFSVDGQQWDIIDRTIDSTPTVLAIGEDEMLVQYFVHHRLNLGMPLESTRKIIPLAAADD